MVLIMADVFAKFSVTGATKKKTSILVLVINMEVAKIVASFMMASDKSSNSDHF